MYILVIRFIFSILQIVRCQCTRVQGTNGSGLTTTIQMTTNVKHLYTMAQEEIITVSQTNPCVITLAMVGYY